MKEGKIRVGSLLGGYGNNLVRDLLIWYFGNVDGDKRRD